MASFSSGRDRGRGRGRSFQDKQNQVENTGFHQKMSTLNTRLPKSNEQGTLGREVQLMVNYFPVLQYPTKGLVYQYYVDIRNLRSIKIHYHRRRGLYQTWLQKLFTDYPYINRSSIVFDNETIILVFDEPLPNIDENGLIQIVKGMNPLNQMEDFKFMIKRVGDPIDFSLLRSPDAFLTAHSDFSRIKQVLSIVLHEHCSSHAEFVYNRSFYSQPIPANGHGHWDLGRGKALWRGFYSCLVFANGHNKLLINLDVNHSVFMRKQQFIDFLCEVMLHSPCGKHKYGRQKYIQKVDIDDALYFLNSDANRTRYDSEANFLLKQCQNLRVRWHYTNKPMISNIQDLGEAASYHTFQWRQRGNQTITVQKYYSEQYGINLRYPSLPLLYMGNKSFIPMELVDVEPVRVKKITDEQRALLCKYSSLSPNERHRAILQVCHNPKQQCFKDDPYIRAYNLHVSDTMLTVSARVLPTPTIVHNNSSAQTRFYKAADFPEVWAMINLSCSLDKEMCKKFYNELSDLAHHRGINIPVPLIYEEFRVNQHSSDVVVNFVKQIIASNIDCRFIFIILPDSDRKEMYFYGSLKKTCELEIGVVTQMIQPRTIQKCITKKGSILEILLLKINSKLNGTNSIVQVHPVIERFFTRGHRIMYVGADLSHGTPGSGNRRSVVAVVASADDVPNRYFKEIYIQERSSPAKGKGRECIIDMKNIMKSLIHQYNQHRGYPPAVIVIYRDGISINEIDTVFIYELDAIRQACIELFTGYQPHLTYIMVNKQHHTRFFSERTNGAMETGTVVDSPEITDATIYDFYLNSHEGQIGTSRPSHYRVLYDDNKLKPDEIQMLTYALCFTYARWAHPVSIPAPVKYADLLAFRAGFYIDMYQEQSRESTSLSTHVTTNGDAEACYNTISKRIMQEPFTSLDDLIRCVWKCVRECTNHSDVLLSTLADCSSDTMTTNVVNNVADFSELWFPLYIDFLVDLAVVDSDYEQRQFVNQCRRTNKPRTSLSKTFLC